MNGDDYSLIIDILYKFHTSTDWVKAVWLICFTSLVLGSLWFILNIIKISLKVKEIKQANASSKIPDEA